MNLTAFLLAPFFPSPSPVNFASFALSDLSSPTWVEISSWSALSNFNWRTRSPTETIAAFNSAGVDMVDRVLRIVARMGTVEMDRSRGRLNLCSIHLVKCWRKRRRNKSRSTFFTSNFWTRGYRTTETYMRIKIRAKQADSSKKICQNSLRNLCESPASYSAFLQSNFGRVRSCQSRSTSSCAFRDDNSPS